MKKRVRGSGAEKVESEEIKIYPWHSFSHQSCLCNHEYHHIFEIDEDISL